MPENDNQYELDENYEPLGIVDAADGSGTTWPEFIEQVNTMDNQVAALTNVMVAQSQRVAIDAVAGCDAFVVPSIRMGYVSIVGVYSQQVIANIPEDYRPQKETYGFLRDDLNAFSVIIINQNYSGNIYIQGTAGKKCYGTGIWFY